MVNISLHVVDIRYRNKCCHSKSPLQVSFLDLMTLGLRNNWEKGHESPGRGGMWQLFCGAPIMGDRRSIPIKADREIFSWSCGDRDFLSTKINVSIFHTLLCLWCHRLVCSAQIWLESMYIIGSPYIQLFSLHRGFIITM